MKDKNTVHISPALLNELQAHASSSYPEEACALLVGTIGGARVYNILKVVLSPNVADDKKQFFEIDPQVRITLEKQLRSEEELQVIGVYHSHPNGAAKPSKTDAEMVIEPDLVWIISSVDAQRNLRTNAFLPAKSGGFSEMTIQQKKAD